MGLDLAIIADDLSGAGDAGLQLAKRGLRTVVVLDARADVADADVLVLDTDSRHVAAGEAAARVGAAARTALRLGARAVYKKVDSTLRGNLGAELDALLDELPGAVAIVAPAFPANGRTVAAGRLLVRGVPLEASEFASDPFWPSRDSRVAAVVAAESRRQTGEMALGIVRRGALAIAAEAERLSIAGAGIVVADAETCEDLTEIARAVAASGGAWVPIGSAGLADALADALSLGSARGSSREPPLRDASSLGSAWPVLIVVGSANPVARRQLAALTAGPELQVVSVRVRALLAGGDEALAEVQRASAALQLALAAGRDVALSLDAGDPGQATLATAPDSRDLAHVAVRLAAGLGDVAAFAARGAPGLAGLVLTGGDTARGVCRALGAFGLAVEREVLPGIPQSRLLGGDRAGLPVVTKAGGFGGTQALIEAVHFLRRI